MFMTKQTVIHYVKDGKQVPKNTKGAKKLKTKTDRYYAVYRENGKTVRVPLAKDKAASKVMLADPMKAKERGKANLSDPYKASKETGLLGETGLVEEYLADLKAKGRSAEHVHEYRKTLNRALKLCRFSTAGNLDGGKLETWLKGLPCSAAMKNKYRQAAFSFGRWLVRKGKLEGNPFANVMRFEGAEAHPRRALPLADLVKLLEAAHDRPLREVQTIRRGSRKGQLTANVRPDVAARLTLKGRERYLTYKTAILTGLREKELQTLKVDHLNLDGPLPYLFKPGKNRDGSGGTKNRKDARLPLKSYLISGFRGGLG